MTKICQEIRLRARELRKEQTPAEQKLWSVLRNRNLGGYKFRRQHAIGRFIVDFYCPETRLVIEVDGSVHANQEAYDLMRTHWLEDRGYAVIRFTNSDIKQRLEGVAAEILYWCDERKKQGR